MNNHEKEEIIKAYIAAYNRFDIEGMMTLLDPDVYFSNLSNEEVTAQANGVEQFRQLAIASTKLFSARSQEPTRFEFGNEVVIVDIAFEGVLAADVPDLAR